MMELKSVFFHFYQNEVQVKNTGFYLQYQVYP